MKKLDIAFWNYDRAQALRDGEVKIEGVDATFHNGKMCQALTLRVIAGAASDLESACPGNRGRLGIGDDAQALDRHRRQPVEASTAGNRSRHSNRHAG